VKTYAEWLKSEDPIEDFLKIGGCVDQSMVDYFAKIVEPVENNSFMVQCGEAVRPKSGKLTFTTFIRIGESWFYAGNHFRNDWMTARFVVDGMYQKTPTSTEHVL
jgi:hypothetical protein